MGSMRIVFAVAAIVLIKGWSSVGRKVKPLCERIDIKTCSRVGYTYTMLPNSFGHKDQNQVARVIRHWGKVLRKHCSTLLEVFLCRVYTPPCIYNQSQIPCRSMCNRIKKDCRRVMKKLRMKWPSSLRCSKLPKKRCFRGIRAMGSPKPAQLKQRLKTPRRVKRKRIKGISNRGECQEIAIPMCQGIGYNLTTFPNMFGHRDQQEAASEVHELSPAVKFGCSSSLNLFLCSMYAPVCTDIGTLPPCRSLCEISKHGCEPLLNKFGFVWPAKFNCSRFPEEGSGETCISKPPDNQTELTNYVTTTEPPTKPRPLITKTFPQADTSPGSGCLNLTIPMCSALGYKSTLFPNILRHRTQDEAMLEMNQFIPLVKIQCSSSLETFLCSVYAPICTELGVISPCRSLCLRSFDGCQPVLKRFGFQWPEQFNCTRFPEEGNGQMCIS